MIKKTMLEILILLISVISVKAQNVEKSIEKQFLDYSTLMIEKNYEKALDYTNEEFFKIIPKEQMIKLITKTMNSTEMEYKTHLPNLTDFEKVKTINNKNYVKFISNSTIEIKMNEKEEDKNKDDEQKKLTFSLYKVSFVKTFGVENVKFNDVTKFFEIKVRKKVIAKSDDKMVDWKFVIVENERQKKLLEKFIPIELME